MKQLFSNNKKVIGSGLAFCLLFAGTAHFSAAQEDDAAVQNRAELAELRKTQRDEVASMRLEQVRAENPELAAEMEAFRDERQTMREDFPDKYPLLSEQRQERRDNAQATGGNGRKGNFQRGAGNPRGFNGNGGPQRGRR